MILRWSSTFRLPYREQWFDPLPLFIRSVASVSHATEFNHYFVFCIQTLVKVGKFSGGPWGGLVL